MHLINTCDVGPLFLKLLEGAWALPAPSASYGPDLTMLLVSLLEQYHFLLGI